MSATAEDVLATLKSIDAHLHALVTHFGCGPKATSTEGPRHEIPTIAPDRDLDGQYGNPEVKAKDPRDWTGPTMKGKRFSECPVAYLELVADRLEYFAQQNDGDADPEAHKKARYNRLDASRARGWAARLRAGWTAPVEAAGFPSDGAAPLTDDDIPF